jgi:UDP-N-acetylglucosamine 2-epimerase (non-hydrolysing)
VRAVNAHKEHLTYKIIHTGQHYDREMSDVFFEELGIPTPDYHLDCGGGSHAIQTAKIMTAFEKICTTDMPDCVLVVGDVNSTLACSITAKKLNIPVAHIEAGLRSGDMNMPEEINRLVTDSISDWFFCTEPSGINNLLREGKNPDKIFHVGHVMVDNLLYQCEKLAQADKTNLASEQLKPQNQKYGVVTLHRPSNVDSPRTLENILTALNQISDFLPLIFPVHPRTRKNLEKLKLPISDKIQLTPPLSYMEFLNLWKEAQIILTDSGGLQEETTALGIPCLTLRTNTERPITSEEGTNTLVGTDANIIITAAENILNGKGKQGIRPELWDGKAASRTIQTLTKLL